MEHKEIRSFIDGWVHDFETVRCLQQFDRTKETLPVVEHICRRLESFHEKISEGPYDLKGIMESDFWDQPFPAENKVSGVRERVRAFAARWPEISEKDLKEIRYGYFLELLEAWVLKNISKIEKRIKTSAQKMFEKTMLAAFCCVVCVAALFFMVSKVLDLTVRRDWGLKGTFYSGQKFETLIGTGSAKAINFSGPRKMSKALPKTNYSVRWQGRILIPKDGKYAFVIEAKDRARLFIAPALFHSDEIVLDFFRNTIRKNMSHLFRVGEFSGSLARMKGLLAALGKGPEQFDNITSAVNWLNSSTEPYRKYQEYLKTSAPDPLIEKSLPEGFLNMTEDELMAWSRTNRGAEVKRAVLKKLFGAHVPKQQEHKAGDLVLRELLGVSAEKDIDQISLDDALAALNKVLTMRDFSSRVKNSYDSSLLDEEIRKILPRAQRNDVSLHDIELSLVNAALLKVIYPGAIKKDFSGLSLLGRRGRHKGVSKNISLKQGVYPVMIEHVQTGGDSFLKFYWKKDGQKERIVPAKYLRFLEK